MAFWSRTALRMGGIGLALALALVAVSAPPAPGQPRPGGELVVAIGQEPDTLDPQKTSTAVTGLISRYLGDTLVTKDLKGNYVPALARSWKISPDGLTWTFELTDGVRFHDGTVLTADAVKASIDRALAPETRSPIAGALFGPVESVRATGPRTLVVKLKQPFAPFLDNLTDPRAMAVSPAAVQRLGAGFGRQPAGTGPWRFAEWRSADRIILARNPDYRWGPGHVHDGPVYLERVIFRIIPEDAAQVVAFERGEVLMLTAPVTDVKRLEQMKRFTFFRFLRKGVGLFMEFNTRREPFADVRVRRGLNHALEKRSILEIALAGLGEVAHGPLPPSIWGYWEGIKDYTPAYSPARARQLLAEAGWTPGAGGVLHRDGRPFRFTLYLAPIDTWRRSAQIVQSQLRAHGIQMEIQTFEFGTLLAKLRAGEQQANFMGYTYTSPDIVYLWFHSSNIGTGLAHSHFKDERLDQMIVESRTSTDPRRRLALYQDIQKYIVDRALWVPLWTNYNYIALQPAVKGAKVHPDGFVVLNDTYLQP
ncbi:MAG: ABC transporter substrate-binding protein [Armatimonadetes bacterium]|nr:ABC transporter substrate-binding protein [Armatimonadota bacterium]